MSPTVERRPLQGSERGVIAGVLLLIALLVVMDVVGDLRQGASAWHVALEILAAGLALLGAVHLLRSTLRLRRRLVRQAEDLSRVRAQAEAWRQQARRHVEGLSRSIDALRVAGRRTSELDGKWWHKISGPLASALMPLLGAVAAFGLARSGQLFVRAVIGMSLGFAYFVVDNAALAMGNFGGYPPLLAAWAPFLLFLLVGETVLIRTEE